MKDLRGLAQYVRQCCHTAATASRKVERNHAIWYASSAMSDLLNGVGNYNEECIEAAEKVLREDALAMTAAFRAARQVVARQKAAIKIKAMEAAWEPKEDEGPWRVDWSLMP